MQASSHSASVRIDRHRNGRFRSPDNARSRSIYKALAAFNATLPRRGRLIRQLSRCFIVNPRPTMKDMRAWCYPGRKREHWHHTNIYRALRRLAASETDGLSR